MVQVTSNPQLQTLYLLTRPGEPIFIPKGRGGAVVDYRNSNFLAKRYQTLNRNKLAKRFQNTTEMTVSVVTITDPDISFPMELERQENFSLFLPYHQDMAAKLIEIFMDAKGVPEFQSTAAYCRDRINPYMWVYAYNVALMHRPDTKAIKLPPLYENMPEKFFNKRIFGMAREECTLHFPRERMTVEIPRDFTASDLDLEHRLAYFREDLGINLHHWHWHLVYPLMGSPSIVKKDRRGELFYYMHHQIQARYNFERLCNNLGLVERLINWREPVKEGYFPKLNSQLSKRAYPPRLPGTFLRDIRRKREQIVFDIGYLERCRDRILNAIEQGSVIAKGGKIMDLTEDGGIDILGDIVESSILSINRDLYGNLHSFGHYLLSLPHDPDHRHLETFGVMGDTATAMRDPVFYRWHAFVDDLFDTYKKTLSPYPEDKLKYDGIKITSVKVETDKRDVNEFMTFWQKRDVDLSQGLDFSARGRVFTTITHLQHAPFEYKIQVENNTNADCKGTFRIFLAPKFDERNVRMFFRDQRLLFIEMDKFEMTLGRSPKTTTIRRKSIESSVAIPFESSFYDLEDRALMNMNLDDINYCACGWPQHMLIPKGTTDGYPCDLFVMFSNIKDDKVEENLPSTGDKDRIQCKEATSFCGLRDQKYPDRRSMGYPFDRMPTKEVLTLQQFLTPNMKVADVKIYYCDITKPSDNVSNTV